MKNESSLLNSASKRTALLLCLQVIGYPLAPCASQFVGIPNVALSYPIRFLTFFLSIIQLPIALSFWRSAPTFIRYYLVAYTVFWIVFYARVLDDLFINPIATNANVPVYVSFPFLVTGIPILALIQPLHERQTRFFRELMLYAGFFCTSLYFINIVKLSPAEKAQKLLEGRFGLDYLNPIQSGYVGGTACLAALSYTIYEATRSQVDRKKVIFGSAAAFFGVTMVLMAASRAPLVAFFAGVVLLLFAESRVIDAQEKRAKLTRRLGVFLFSLTAIVFIGAQFVFGLNPFGRFETAFGDDPYNKNSGTHRLLIGDMALDHFGTNPIVGNSAFVNSSEPYPHNLILESLMSGGAMTTIPFLFLIFGGLLGFVKLFRSGKNPLIVALAFTYSIASNNSGAISENTEFWGLLAVLLGFSVTLGWDRDSNSAERAHSG